MKKLKVEIIRVSDNGKQTEGVLYILEDKKIIFECKTLELPWKENKNKVSCIPAGSYILTHRTSKKFNYPHFILSDTGSRIAILIHAGNYSSQIEGCILVGDSFADINKDGLIDVTNSKVTLSKIVKILSTQSKINLEIKYS